MIPEKIKKHHHRSHGDAYNRDEGDNNFRCGGSHGTSNSFAGAAALLLYYAYPESSTILLWKFRQARDKKVAP
jgi:hypothetical protein